MDGSSFLIARGLFALILGVLALAWPAITVMALIVIFGIYAVADGTANVMHGIIRTQLHGRSWTMTLQGLFGVMTGVIVLTWPGVTALVLVAGLGAWAIAMGIFEIVEAVRLHHHITGEWLLALSGLVSIMFGLVVITLPSAGAVTIAGVLGLYAAATGVLLIIFGVRVRTGVTV